MSEYPNMPEPDGFIKFDGVDYPYWIVEHKDEAVKVSTTALQEKLFVGGDTDGDYVCALAETIDEDVAFFVDKGDSVDTAKDAIWDVKAQNVPYVSPVDRIRGIVARLKRPDTKAPWIVKHTHQVYRLDAFDLGDHVAEFESNGDAEHAVACVNAILGIENILKEVENA